MSSVQPTTIEARIGAQERMVTILHACIEEVSINMSSIFREHTERHLHSEQRTDALFEKVDARSDKIEMRVEELSQSMTAGFKQSEERQLQTERKNDARFDAVDARFDAVDARLDKMDTHFEVADRRSNKIEADLKELTRYTVASSKQFDINIKALSDDLVTRFTRLEEYHHQNEQQTNARFEKIEANMATKDDIAAVRTDMASMATKDDIAAIRVEMASMATKDDIAAMENRILDTIKQLIYSRPPRPE